jgi:hypothetical protein
MIELPYEKFWRHKDPALNDTLTLKIDIVETWWNRSKIDLHTKCLRCGVAESSVDFFNISFSIP